jgi:Avidin family
MHRFVTAILLLVIATVTASAQSLPIPSYWQNQRYSEMSITGTGPCQGCFVGKYWNHAAGFKCQASPTNPVPYDVKGRVLGVSVWFTVVWNNGIENCNSVTAWFGTVRGDTMPTNWVLVGQGINPPLRGTDIFTRH